VNRAPTIAEVKARLSLAEAASRLGYSGELAGLCRSPFPSEHKHADRNKSFSVFDGGRRWRNHATDEGGDVLDFIAKFTGCTPAEALALARGWLGWSPAPEHPNRRTPKPRPRAEPHATPASTAPPPPPAPEAPAWTPRPLSGEALMQWEEGLAYLREDSDFGVEIDLWRGWPTGTTSALAAAGLVAAPRLRGPTRALAFAVEAPTPAGRLLVGFHARHEPAVPDAVKRWSFHPTGTPSLPFVLGSFPTAGRVVVLEGQWDAVTFAAAAGWFAPGRAFPADTAVLGIRGATAWRVFLRVWGDFWPPSPAFLLIPDADPAGRKWLDEFASELRQRAARVVVLVPRESVGKDFSDLNHARPFAVADIARLLEGLRAVDREGGAA
jgi:hypothetical protein